MPSLLHALGFPHPPYALRILRRTIAMWLLLKLFLMVILSLLGIIDGLSALLLPSLGVPALLVFIDRVRAHERLLQANLGASEWWLAIATVATSVAFDAVTLTLASLGGLR